MRRKVFLAGVLAASIGLLAVGAVASSAVFSTHSAKAPTVINVVAGKPSELKFQLSKSTKLASPNLTEHPCSAAASRGVTATTRDAAGRVSRLLQQMVSPSRTSRSAG